MKVYKSYARVVLDWVKKHVYFTHKDIARLTNCNCPYSVLRDLKRLCKVSEEMKQKTQKFKDSNGNTFNVTKMYKVYKFEGMKAV